MPVPKRSPLPNVLNLLMAALRFMITLDMKVWLSPLYPDGLRRALFLKGNLSSVTYVHMCVQLFSPLTFLALAIVITVLGGRV